MVHEYASELTATPKAELFCSCKRRKYIGQIKSIFLNYKVKILSFEVKNWLPYLSEWIWIWAWIEVG